MLGCPNIEGEDIGGRQRRDGFVENMDNPLEGEEWRAFFFSIFKFENVRLFVNRLSSPPSQIVLRKCDQLILNFCYKLVR